MNSNINKYSEQVLMANQFEIVQLLSRIKRDNANVEGLIKKLESSDFFRAPASTKYHNSFIGGLADHSLNTYYNLKSLVEHKGLKAEISEESIIICGLLHDMSKMNFYELISKNEKVYDANGSKYDALGRYDWQTTMGYKIKDDKERFIYGNHEETSVFMVRTYIPLTVEEASAILTHHGGMGHDSISVNSIPAIYNEYTLASLLHLADMLSTYVDERI